uniref:Uncharacterized protein n=1 Tax=Siphoviridae sp. ctbBv3 TaxID=2826392 RepID=A0A8S5NIX1_9CAUD|nr:MAG TPA: hypothetical protein [Siphoviridae sp. ctbBv3]
MSAFTKVDSFFPLYGYRFGLIILPPHSDFRHLVNLDYVVHIRSNA